MNLNSIISRLILIVSISFALIISTNSYAVEKIENIEKLKKTISEKFSGIGQFDIQPSPIKGLYLVIVPPRVLYISKDANFMFEGDIKNINTGENITAGFRNISRITAVEAMKDTMIIFAPPKGKIKHTISVFTDIDCFYCQKLHKEIAEYNKYGIEVRYLSYPRSGVNTPSYFKAVSVWCSEDKKAAFTKAKNGEEPPRKTCDNPVDEHFALGNLLGVRGTPAIVLENGQIYPGYIPAKRLSEALDAAKAKTN